MRAIGAGNTKQQSHPGRLDEEEFAGGVCS
jgi:hypothetical protein